MIAGLVGLLFGFLAGVFLLVGLIPLLGWMNWFTSLPLAGVALVFSRLAVRGKGGSALGTAGTVICTLVIALALFRLSLSHGIL